MAIYASLRSPSAMTGELSTSHTFQEGPHTGPAKTYMHVDARTQTSTHVTKTEPQTHAHTDRGGILLLRGRTCLQDLKRIHPTKRSTQNDESDSHPWSMQIAGRIPQDKSIRRLSGFLQTETTGIQLRPWTYPNSPRLICSSSSTALATGDSCDLKRSSAFLACGHN